MNRAKNQTGRRFFMIGLAHVLLLMSSSYALAQGQVKVTANPSSITDPAKPTPIVLNITKPDGSAVDPAFKGLLDAVTVGGANATAKPFDPANGNIEITPPANLTGAQKVQLLDKSKQLLGETQIQYPNATATPNPTVSPTPTPDRWEDRRDAMTKSNWYYFIVTLLFAGLLIPFVLTLVRVIRFSKSSFRSPFGFPVGSFRAILAYTLVAYLGFYIMTSLLSVTLFNPPDFLLGIVATVVGFYFGSRTGEEGTGDPSAGIVRGLVRQGTNPARGAAVKFKRDDGTEPYSRITDLNGHFELQGAKPGKYKVTAALTGSPASDPQEINVAEGSDQEIEIVIKASTQTPPPPATATMQGTVTKAVDNSPVDKATVVLSQNNVEKGKATTDATGKYKIENIAFGTYKIVASVTTAAGELKSDAKTVNVTTASPDAVDLQVKP